MTAVLGGERVEHPCTMNPGGAEADKPVLGYADRDRLISSSDKP